jgi:hypothetical protein
LKLFGFKEYHFFPLRTRQLGYPAALSVSFENRVTDRQEGGVIGHAAAVLGGILPWCKWSKKHLKSAECRIMLSGVVYAARAGLGVLTGKTPCGLAGELNHHFGSRGLLRGRNVSRQGEVQRTRRGRGGVARTSKLRSGPS